MRSMKVAAALVAVTALFAGCGGVTDDGSESSSSAGGGGGEAPGVTDDTITFGMVAPLTGPVSALGLDSRAAVESFMAKVNADGGINGRKLELLVQDDKYDPKQAVAGAKYFTGQKPVFGIWGNVGTATTLASLPVYESAGMPLLFPEALTEKIYPYDRAYALVTGFGESYKVLSDYMATDDQFTGKTIGFLYQNDGTSIESLNGFKEGATKVDAATAFERTANSYAPQVERLKSAGAEVVLYVGNPSQMAVALKEADSIGFKPQWIGSLGITSPELTKLAGDLAEGVMTVNPHASPQGELPGPTRFRAAMSEYRPDATQSGYALFSWIGGEIIVDALKRAGKDLTRESFLKALDETQNLDVGGLLPPVTLSPDRRIANDCIILLENSGGKFDRGDNEFVCP